MTDQIIHPLRYTFGYSTGFIFLVGITIYLYLLLTEHLENSAQHTYEEKIWIYSFLIIMILGLGLSYYSITCDTYCLNKKIDNKNNIENA